MSQTLLEAGKIVNTHGIHGEIKIVPWADSAEFLCGFRTYYIDGAPVAVLDARVHKGSVIAKLANISDVNAAVRLKNKVVSIDRADVTLPEGQHFIADLIGLEVRNAQTGEPVGKVTEVLTPPANKVYVVEGEKTYLIPAVDAFIAEINVPGGYLRVNMIEGLEQ